MGQNKTTEHESEKGYFIVPSYNSSPIVINMVIFSRHIGVSKTILGVNYWLAINIQFIDYLVVNKSHLCL